MKTPRPYQREAIDALYKYWQGPSPGNGLIVLPTGTGKSLVNAILVKELIEMGAERILVLTHVKELIQQDFDEIKEHWPEAPIGIFSASLGRKDFHHKIIVAGIQSLAAHAHKLDPAPEIIIIDEAHLVPRNDSTRYMTTIKTFRAMYPHLKVIGLSATPYRLDSGYLHHGDGAIFDQIIYDAPIQAMIDQGYLAPVTTKSPPVKIDTDGVRHSGREFVAGDLEDHILESGVTAAAVADMIERGKDRKKWIVFAAGLKHAAEINELLIEAGIESAVISGDTPMAERDSLIESFKGRTLAPLRCLVNVSVLTTGFNVPAVDFIALMRPTESAGLYVQMVGRGTRIAPGKTDCLVADYAGLTLRHGPIDAVDPTRDPSKGDGVPPAKECPDCMTIIHAGLRVCPVCGHEFPPSAPMINRAPVEAPILARDIVVEETEMEVEDTIYEIHRKEGKAESVKVSYRGRLETVNEWVFPASTNQWGDFNYRKWCKAAGMEEPFPRTAADFVERHDLPQAKKIWTAPDGKWTRVKRREWAEGKKIEYSDEIPF